MTAIGLMGAMPEEMDQIVAMMDQREEIMHGNRVYHKGLLYGMPVVAVFSRWGKVAAASTATSLIEVFGVNKIVFTGVAGGIAPDLSVGDVVIGERLVQHDMDARPLMARYEVPLTSRVFFEADKQLMADLQDAAREMIKQEQDFIQTLIREGLTQPKRWVGDIASGDQFIGSTTQKEEIASNLPSVLCAEMEGAAVAQVCHDFDVPLGIVRVISDTADESSHAMAMKFVDLHAAHYLQLLVHHYFVLQFNN
ncbi:MAG: 5'-methylthioadenosine/adenosylhomocysteine nucleosidase [Paludibacter sp.]|nr:5'-methylthioadenosine/adenosylhomocysteine nucleosidase [Paludibacter sp.]